MLTALGGQAEAVRQLAYRLYALCERIGQAEYSRACNELITSWIAIESAATITRNGNEKVEGNNSLALSRLTRALPKDIRVNSQNSFQRSLSWRLSNYLNTGKVVFAIRISIFVFFAASICVHPWLK